MKRAVCALLAACATGLAQPAQAQEAVTRIGAWSHATALDYYTDPISVAEGSFYFEEFTGAKQSSPLRLVRIDALTGERTVLAEPMQGRFTRLLAMTPNRVVARGGRGIVLYDRKTWQNLTDITLADATFDVVEAPNRELLFLQRSRAKLTIARFDDEDLTFHGEIQAPVIGFGDYYWPNARFHDGEIMAGEFGASECARLRTCLSLRWLDMDAKQKATLDLTFPAMQNASCGGAGIVAAVGDLVIAHMDCKYFAIDNRARQVRFQIGSAELQMPKVMVLDELLVAPEGPKALKPGEAYPTNQKLFVFDRRTGASLGTLELPRGEVDAIGGDKLVVRLPLKPGERDKLNVEVYRVNAARVRQLGGQGVGPRP